MDLHILCIWKLRERWPTSCLFRATFAWCHIRHYIKTFYHWFSNCKEWKWNRPLTRLTFIPLRVKNSLGHTFTVYTYIHTYTCAGQGHQEICNSKYCWSSCHLRSVRSLGLRRWVTTYQSHSQSHSQSSLPPALDHFQYVNTVDIDHVTRFHGTALIHLHHVG